MATIPSGNQEGSSTTYTISNSITGQSSQIVTNDAHIISDVIAYINTLNSATINNSGTVTTNALNSATINNSGAATTATLNINSTQTTITGTTAGSAIISMPFTGSSYKKVIVYLNGYENDTTTAQTYTFPVAFTNTPNVYNPGSVPGITVTTTTLSMAPDTTTAYTGWIIIEGY